MYLTKEQIVHFVETFSLRCHLQEINLSFTFLKFLYMVVTLQGTLKKDFHYYNLIPL